MGQLLVKLLHENAKAPTVAFPGEDLGFDIYALEDTFLEPFKPTIVKTGIAAVYEATNEYIYRNGNFPDAKRPVYGLEVEDRSGMAAKNGIHILAGKIDGGYRDGIGVVMILLGEPTHIHPDDESKVGAPTGWMDDQFHAFVPRRGYRIKAGDKIAQLIPREILTSEQILVVDELPYSKRGVNGFGSTGR